jgi:uncharacterized protein
MQFLLRGFLLLLATFIQMLAFAQKAKNNPEIPTQLDKTLLWKVSGKGIKTAYIYGTIHMISQKDFFMADATLKAFNKCKSLITEIDMSNQMALAVQMLKLAPMKNAMLKNLLSETDYNIVKNYFEKESNNPELKMMPFSMVENWKPMLLQSFLYTDMIEKPVKAYEMEFVSLAQKRKKMQYGGLETIDDQMNIFETIPYATQAKALVEMIQQIKQTDDTGANEFAELVALYKSQDIDGMVAHSQKSFDEMGDDSENALLTNRNKNWIPQIAEMGKKTTCFFAVGAAHLGGENGIIRLLMKEGYKVEPISNQP